MRALPLLIILLGLGACRPEAQRTGEGQTGQVADSELVRTDDSVEAANTGIELEAPRLIPGLRAQLSAMRDTAGGVSEGNVAAYRQLASDVVTAMLTDLNRAGSPAVDEFRTLGDTVVMLVGGGAGEAPEPSREDLGRSTAILERLIERYRQAMAEARR